MCSPGTASVTGTRSDADTNMNDARPSDPRETSSARTSASGARPNVTTRAEVLPAYPATMASSAFRMATPSGPRASTGSADASTMRSHEPKTSRWATPTFVTMTMSGRAIPQRIATSPTRRAPISATTTWVSAGAPSRVIGRPTSLFNDSRLAWVRNLVARTAPAMSFVDVFPFAPVTAITFASIRDRSSRASIISASPVDRTETAGPSTSRPSRTSAPAAPFANASGTKRPPSVRSPGSATNNPPGTTSRESIATDVTSTSWPRNSPSTARATSDIRRGFMRPLPARRAPRARRRGRRTGSSVAELLHGLVSLPGDDHDVARGRLPQRQPDRRSPVGLDHERAAALLRAGLDLGDDRQGILRARVVRGDDRQVRIPVAAAPIGERFARSRSPPQPNTRIRRPDVSGRDARSTLRMLSGVCA